MSSGAKQQAQFGVAAEREGRAQERGDGVALGFEARLQFGFLQHQRVDLEGALGEAGVDVVHFALDARDFEFGAAQVADELGAGALGGFAFGGDGAHGVAHGDEAALGVGFGGGAGFGGQGFGGGWGRVVRRAAPGRMPRWRRRGRTGPRRGRGAAVARRARSYKSVGPIAAGTSSSELDQGVAGHLRRRRQAHEGERGGGEVLERAVVAQARGAAEVDQRHRAQGVGGVRPGRWRGRASSRGCRGRR